MSNLEVYYSNHEKALKFPWSIYHMPLLRSLNTFLDEVKPGENILVIGPGAFQELQMLLDKKVKVSILDIDPRILEFHQKNSQGIENFYLVDDMFAGYPANAQFDRIYAKEVIEHIPEYANFLKVVRSCLKPEGKVWLSTPNYGYFLLPLLENTVLELIARFTGFSRKDIHPAKFDAERLKSSLESAFFKDVKVEIMPFKLSLVVTARNSATA